MKTPSIALALIAVTGIVHAGDLVLKPETLAAWDSYVAEARDKMQARLAAGSTFMWMDEQAGRREKIHQGEIIVEPASQHIPRRVPSGLIHDWISGSFIPDTKISEVLEVLRDYSHYKDHYKPGAVESKTISMGANEDRFSVLLRNSSVIAKTALDSEYKSSNIRVDAHRAYGITQSTRIQEIDNYGTPKTRTLPVDEGSGIIWRLFSISRYEERDGGVYVEIEAMALSRDVPGALRWVIEPIVRRVSRSSLITSMQQTRDAVRSAGEVAHHNGALTSASRAKVQ